MVVARSLRYPALAQRFAGPPACAGELWQRASCRQSLRTSLSYLLRSAGQDADLELLRPDLRCQLDNTDRDCRRAEVL